MQPIVVQLYQSYNYKIYLHSNFRTRILAFFLVKSDLQRYHTFTFLTFFFLTAPMKMELNLKV